MDSKYNIDEKAIERLKKKIILAESSNLRTNNKKPDEMIKDIKKWIEEEDQCCSNQ